MKPGKTISFSIAVAFLAFVTPQLVRAQGEQAMNSTGHSTYSSPIQNPTAAKEEAALMVPAQAHLAKTLDARKSQAGSQFEAIVDGTVRLQNGTELPRGTVLVGKIASDEMRAGGTSSLALRFTEAKLKNGQTVPIHAMIVGIGGPVAYDSGYPASAGAPPMWNRQTLQVDQVGALSNVDMHSRIAGANSGVFVSTKKDDVKLAGGSQITLAIGGASHSSSGV